MGQETRWGHVLMEGVSQDFPSSEMAPPLTSRMCD